MPAQVLHMDRNSYYGGESASFNLTQVWTLCEMSARSRYQASFPAHSRRTESHGCLPINGCVDSSSTYVTHLSPSHPSFAMLF
jgi:GDP dissociation inhibitor